MALNVGRWFKYAQARLDAAVRSGHEELDELEAERAAQVAERPWLGSDAEVPTFDEARARIEGTAAAPIDADAEAAQARLEVDRRARESADRLDAIRRELGVEPPEET